MIFCLLGSIVLDSAGFFWTLHAMREELGVPLVHEKMDGPYFSRYSAGHGGTDLTSARGQFG